MVYPGSVSVPSSWGSCAGDLGTLIVDVQNKTGNCQDYNTLINKTKELLGASPSLYSFCQEDLLADIDCVNIGYILKSNPSLKISDAIQKYYSSNAYLRILILLIIMVAQIILNQKCLAI